MCAPPSLSQKACFPWNVSLTYTHPSTAVYPYPGGGALQVQGDSKMDKLFCPEFGEEEGGGQVEELPHMPGLRSISTAVGHMV